MKTLRAVFVRFTGLFRRALERAMQAEMESHLGGLTERNRAAGMSPEDARCAALRDSGNVAKVAELARDQRRSMWVEQLCRIYARAE